MDYMSAKFDEEAQNGLVYRVHKLISIYVNCDLDLCPLTSKIHRVHPRIIVNMSAKFAEEAHNGLVSIMFIRSTHGWTHMRNQSSVTTRINSPQRVAQDNKLNIPGKSSNQLQLIQRYPDTYTHDIGINECKYCLHVCKAIH